jgi:hypothetical protein
MIFLDDPINSTVATLADMRSRSSQVTRLVCPGIGIRRCVLQAACTLSCPV